MARIFGIARHKLFVFAQSREKPRQHFGTLRAENVWHDLGLVIERAGVQVELCSESARLFVFCAVNDALYPRVHYRTRAHRARLKRYVYVALVQPPPAELSTRGVDRFYLRVAQGVFVCFARVELRETIFPSHTTTAPTGTSPICAARFACSIASFINNSSFSKSASQNKYYNNRNRKVYRHRGRDYRYSVRLFFAVVSL